MWGRVGGAIFPPPPFKGKGGTQYTFAAAWAAAADSGMWETKAGRSRNLLFRPPVMCMSFCPSTGVTGKLTCLVAEL